MKITEVRTRVAEWRGETVPPQPHTCTNPVDLLDLPSDAMPSALGRGCPKYEGDEGSLPALSFKATRLGCR